ncbi:MAG: metalloregulator ArsR/SmtB family transcription factor [Proteobacteria bacterium]|nr:metalloregulator ArsR/SmtB family transcription factor [Pseudomonadota bacterium]
MIIEIKKIKAMACSVRLRILNVLLHKKEGLFVCDIVNILESQQYNISKHLIILKNANLVTDEKVGRSVLYKFNSENSAIADFIKSMNLSKYPEYKRDIERLDAYSPGKCSLLHN